jgi:hypothetical protein
MGYPYPCHAMKGHLNDAIHRQMITFCLPLFSALCLSELQQAVLLMCATAVLLSSCLWSPGAAVAVESPYRPAVAEVMAYRCVYC